MKTFRSLHLIRWQLGIFTRPNCERQAKPGETYDVPAAAIMMKRSRPGYESRLKAIFPKFSKYEEWEGSGHFLMLESPERFNRSLEEFLAGLP